MKTNLIVALFITATAAAFGQGWVQFRNYYTGTTPPVDAPVYLYGYGLADGSTGCRAALIGGPTTATPTSASTLGTLQMMFYPTTAATSTISWVGFRTGSTPPAFAGYVAYGSTVARAVPGVDWGGTALVQMVGWQGNYTTWADAYNAALAGTPGVMIGWSNPLTLQLPSSATDPNFAYLWGLNSFVIGIPEPNSFALLGVGAALWVLRRR